MLIPSKLVVGSPVPPLHWHGVGGCGWWCAAIFSNIPTIHLSQLRAKCNGCLYTPGLLVSVFIIIFLSLVCLLLEIFYFKLEIFLQLLTSEEDDLLGVLIISQDSWLSPGNY